MKRTSVFWAVALIALGVLLLLRETVGAWKDVSVGGLVLIAIGGWMLYVRPWYGRVLGGRALVPAVLIAVGAVILLRDLDVLPGDFPVAPIVLIVIGAAILVAALPMEGGGGPLTSESIPLDGATSARVAIHHAAGSLIVGPASSPDVVLEGAFAGGVEPQVRRAGDRVDVTLRQRWHRGSWRAWGHRGARGFEWAVSLSRLVPLALEVRSGASTSRLELQELRVTHLVLEAGASQTDVVLPATGRVSARIQAGAARVRARIPTGVAARIRVRRGLAAVNVDTVRFPPSADGYRSPDYDVAESRVDLEVEAGAAEVSVS